MCPEATGGLLNSRDSIKPSVNDFLINSQKLHIAIISGSLEAPLKKQNPELFNMLRSELEKTEKRALETGKKKLFLP